MVKFVFTALIVTLNFTWSLSFAKTDSFSAQPADFSYAVASVGTPCLGADYIGVSLTGMVMHCVDKLWKSASVEAPSGTICGFGGGSNVNGVQPTARCGEIEVSQGCPTGYQRIASKDGIRSSGNRGPNRYFCAKT